jgi:hypothetical protein
MAPSGTEQGDAFLPYSAHLEECFKDRFGPGRLDLLLKIVMDAPDEFVDDNSQQGDFESDDESMKAKEKEVTAPAIQRAPFPAHLLVTMDPRITGPGSSIDGFYKAWKDTGDEWPQDWIKEGPPVGEAPCYRLIHQRNEGPSQAAVFFMESTEMWTHTGRDGSVLYVCPGKKRTEVPTDGWIRPSSQHEMAEGNVVPSYFFDTGPFEAYFGRVTEGSIFRTVDHARLVHDILGEVFNLDEMQKQGILTCHFVPHHSSSLRFFKAHITSWWHPWHNQWPLEHIRDYFGEKVALEHDFLGFLAGMCFLLGLAALVQCILPEHLYSRTAFGVFTVIWAATLTNCWQRRELQNVVRWGTDNNGKQQDIVSPLADDQGHHWSLSNVMVLGCFRVPSVLILWTIVFQWLLHVLHCWLSDQHVAYAVQIQAAVNAVQMLIVDGVCKATLPRLCRTHASNTEDFDKDLLRQMLIHRGIIAYTTLLLGYLLRPLAGLCGKGVTSCDEHLGNELEVIFAIRVLASILHGAVMIHRAKMSFKKSGQTNGYEQMGHGEAWQPRSYIEAQAQMPPRDRLQMMTDYMDIVIQLGYVLLFGALRPRIALLLLCVTIFRVHGHAWELLADTRRPFPEAAQGLGARKEVLNTVVSLSVFSTSIILVLINSDPPFAGAEASAALGPSRLLEPYVIEQGGDVDPVRLLIMIVAMKCVLSFVQSLVRPLVPRESRAIANARKWQCYLLKQLRENVLGVKEELAEPQKGEEQAKSPEQLIRAWVVGAQQLDMDDEDFEPAAAAKLDKEMPAAQPTTS